MNFKMQKTQRSSFKIVTSEAFQRVTNETLQESHLKFGKSLAPRTKHKIFKFKKNEKHIIMEAFKNKKPQCSSFKITTCERFKMVNNDALQELCQIRQQLGTTYLGAHQSLY